MLSINKDELLPVFTYDEVFKEILIQHYIACDINKLISNDYLTKTVDDEFRLSVSVSEYFLVMYWDSGFKPIGLSRVSKGLSSTANFKFSTIFRIGILCKASYITLIHNHPSGLLISSKHDDIATENIATLGMLLDIKLHQHLVIADGKYSVIS